MKDYAQYSGEYFYWIWTYNQAMVRNPSENI